MKTIVIASQKGGVGKTTIAGHLAVEAHAAGSAVVMIDTDAQGSLSSWWNVRKDEEPALVMVSKAGLKATLAALEKQGTEYVIIDTPGSANKDTAATIQLADLVLIPVTPSPHDTRAVGLTVDLVVEADRPMVFVVNGATQRARITGQTAVALSQHGTVSPVTLHRRTDFATSAVDGRTVGELDPGGKSATEIKDLWNYINKRLTMGKKHGAATK
jgi:chromosome partitioning protein